MTDLFSFSIALAGGFLTGIFFFGGLWLTVRNGIASKYAAAWFAVSFIIRLVVTLAAFYYVGAGSLARLLLCLSGFLAARIIVSGYTKRRELKNQEKIV